MGLYMKIIAKEELVDILKIRRKKLGLTQSEVAKKLGLTTMGFSYIERGARALRVETLDSWAEALGLEPEINLVERKKL